MALAVTTNAAKDSVQAAEPRANQLEKGWRNLVAICRTIHRAMRIVRIRYEKVHLDELVYCEAPNGFACVRCVLLAELILEDIHHLGDSEHRVARGRP